MKIPIFDVSTFFHGALIENGRFDLFLHWNATGNTSHLKEQKKCYRISIVSEDRGGGAYRATIHPRLSYLATSSRKPSKLPVSQCPWCLITADESHTCLAISYMMLPCRYQWRNYYLHQRRLCLCGFVFCPSVRLSANIPVCNVTQNKMNGFLWNCLERSNRLNWTISIQ